MLIFIFLIFFLVSCDNIKSTSEFKKKQKAKNILSDTIVNLNNIAVFPYSENQFIFKNSKDYNLTNQDLKEIEVLLQKSIIDYNETHKNYLLRVNEPLINLQNYKRQYVAVINSNNEKEVWINFVCNRNNANWKKYIIEVDDGGSCYFNLKINLTKKKFYDFIVNGVA